MIECSTMNIQNVVCTVDELSQFFTGQLKCIKCKKRVEFSNDLLTQHLKNCSENLPESSVGCEDLNSSEIIDQFREYLCSRSSDGSQPNFPNTPSTTSIDILKKIVQSVKLFRCLFCNSSGNIEDWERHLLECYRATGSPLWCTCLSCETLLYGEQKAVTDHAHFKKDVSFFSLSHFPCIVDVLKNKSTNYFMFERKVLRKNPKLGFYCGACDLYLFTKVDKHFSSYSHRKNAIITCDLFYCSTCFIIIYGDDRLFQSHILSKNHATMKTSTEQTLPIKLENFQHKFALMSVKATMEKNLKTNCTSQSYYCDLCSFTATTIEIWTQHLSSNVHHQKTLNETHLIANDEIKPFEYMCIHCKLSIFGTIFTHVMHCTSQGHEAIKNVMINYHNDANMKAVMETEKLRSILIPSVSSNSKNYSQFNGNPASSLVTVSYDQSSSIHNDSVEREFPLKDAVITDAQLIHVRNLDTKNSLKMFENLRTFLRETWDKLKVQECKTNCAYCNDFSSNDSTWWAHLGSQPHIDKMNQHFTTTKSSKAIILFCLCCNISILGPLSIEKRHSTRAQHKKKFEHFAQLFAPHDTKPDVSESSSEAELKPVSNEIIENTTSQFPEAFRTKAEFPDDLNESRRTNEVEFFRTQSMSSNASSKNDNEDRSEDEGDVVSYVLLNGVDDGAEKISDHELDDYLPEDGSNSTPKDLNTSQGSNNNTIDDKNTEFIKHLIIAKGIPPQIIENKRICLETFRRYGVIKRIFTKKNKPDWLYLMVLTEPEEVFNRLHQNIKTLKVTLGTDELSIEYDTRNTDQTGIRKNLACDVKDLFSNLSCLNEAVQNSMRLYEEESNSNESKVKIRKLENTVLELAQRSYGPSIPIRVFTFGSRVTGLATKNSDVDIYLQIDHSFGGGVHENVPLQQQLVLYFSNRMKKLPSDFRNIVSIPFARVPIVKFNHIKTNLNCDLSFKSGLSTMNSILVKTYLQLDDRIKYLVCAVKLWMKKNDLADRNLFTTYAQIWMVLFFLMQPEHAVVPTVLTLRKELPPMQQEVFVEGWNCSFPKVYNIVWRSNCSLSKEELLLKFFQFYGKENLQNYVMCTLTGIKMRKEYFHEKFLQLPPTFDEYKNKLKKGNALFYKVVDDFEGLCIQDPFDHCHNLTKTIGVRKFLSFINLCQQTVDVMKTNFITT